MSFGNLSELFFLDQICFVRSMLFSISGCLVFAAGTEHKIGLLYSTAIHRSVMTGDTCAVNHVVRHPQSSLSVFLHTASHQKLEVGLGMRLIPPAVVNLIVFTYYWGELKSEFSV